MTVRPYRFGFVGCGPIARYHADVVRALGHEVHAVCTRTVSPRRTAFMRDFAVEHAYESVDDLLRRGRLDALVLAVPWNRTEAVVNRMADTELPCLVEKPVALSADALERLLARSPGAAERILVGYNRRFYDFVPELEEAVAARRVISVSASFPDALNIGPDAASQAFAAFGLIYVTSHGLDLLGYLLGELRVLHMFRQLPLGSGGFRAYDGMLCAAAGDIPIHLQVHFDASSQHELSFHFEDGIYRLSPMERLTIYRGLERLEPTRERPIRRYAPRVDRTVDVDAAYKPGFHRQMANFIDTCVSGLRPNTAGCTLPEALRVLRLCETIDGRRAVATMAS